MRAEATEVVAEEEGPELVEGATEVAQEEPELVEGATEVAQGEEPELVEGATEVAQEEEPELEAATEVAQEEEPELEAATEVAQKEPEVEAPETQELKRFFNVTYILVLPQPLIHLESLEQLFYDKMINSQFATHLFELRDFSAWCSTS